MDERDSISVALETIELNINDTTVEYPLLIVKIWGKQNLVTMLKLMNDIRDKVSTIETDYISLTDFTNLDASNVMETIISNTMNSSLKTLIKVLNIAKISFITFGNDSSNQMFKKKLLGLNKKISNSDYKYSYVSINDTDELKKKAEKILSESN